MLVFEIAIGLILVIATIHFWITKQKHSFATSLIAKQMNSSEQMKRTLAMGLYYRFHDASKSKMHGAETSNEHLSSLFIRQTPLAFEAFVAEVMETALGGATWVSPPTNDYGVDFEHERQEELYLGQVKCFKNDVDFEPIALIHSNMIKRNAVGGYVITTSSFSKNAKEYAKGLNIELIDGIRLVEYWLEGLEETESLLDKFGVVREVN